MQTGTAADFADDARDDACRLTAARAADEAPGLWHDLARRWLGPRRPEHHAASDKAAEGVSALCIALA
jgi:hypothetical protein